MNTNPYPGLRAFEYAENHLFFGREGHAQKIANRLEQNHFVAVVGSSGSGKSSVVRAGLLPLLYSGRMFRSSSGWKISVMRPGDTPINNLAEALVQPEKFDDSELYGGENSRPPKDEAQIGIVETILRRSGVGLVDYLKTADLEAGENLLIVVDQFEELFRFKEKMRVGYSDEAAAFVKLLLEATKDKQNPIYIITTMRSDFLGDCAEFRGLPEAINDGQYLVSRMTRNQLRSSIESPAKVFDAEVSPVLVNHLLNNLEDDGNQSLEFRERMLQDQLPVMQHALMRTWDEWESRNTPNEQIGMEHYKSIGGMEKALLNHANEAFEELDGRQKFIAEKMFKSLTEKDEEKRETRRPTTVAEICAVAEAEKEEVFAVIEIFRREGRTFLMPPPAVPLTENTKIDISHESLIRNWDVLTKWVEEEAKDAWHYRRLSEAANEWIYEKDRDEDFLWRGRVVEEAVEWWESFAPNQVWAERYQILNDREKTRLAEISRTSPDEVSVRRENLMKQRFEEAELFLAESQEYELREQNKKERLRQAEARGRYTKWLAGAASLLFVLLGATAYFAYDAVMTGRSLMAKEQELIAKNKDLVKEQNKLKEAQKKLNEINKDLQTSNEEERKQREEAVKQSSEANKQREKAQEERRNALTQKQRADREARLAKISENQAKVNAERAKKAEKKAQENFENAKIAGERAEKLAETLKMSKDGFVNLEYENFLEAKTNFEQYLDAIGEQDQKFGKWWGNHNLAITNWNLSKNAEKTAEFTRAESKFIEALRELGYDAKSILVKESDEVRNSTINFSPISYKTTSFQNTDETEREIERSIIITLRKFAKFYWDFANDTELNKKAKCDLSELELEEADFSVVSVPGDDLDATYKVPCLTHKAKRLYESLLAKKFDNREIKADIQIEFAELLLEDIQTLSVRVLLKEKKVSNKEKAIDLYDEALNIYKGKSRISKYIATHTKVIEFFLGENEIDEANNRVDKIIEVKKDSLEQRSGINQFDALTHREFQDIYFNLSKLYSKRLSEYQKEYSQKIRELRDQTQNDQDIKEFLDKLSTDIINSTFERRDYQIILDSNEELRSNFDEVFSQDFPVSNFEELSNKTDGFSFIGGRFDPTFGDKLGIAEGYFLTGQCENAVIVLESLLKDKIEKPEEKNEIKLVRLAEVAEIYRKYNYENKAKEKYLEFYKFYEEVAENVHKFTYGETPRWGLVGAYYLDSGFYPNLFRKAGRFFYFNLGDNYKALTLFSEGERLLQIKDPESIRSRMRMQLYIGFALESENSSEAIDHYKKMLKDWSDYRKNITTNQDSPNDREIVNLDVFDALDALLRVRLADLYIKNNEPQKVNEVICSTKNCIDSIRVADKNGLTLIYPEKYLPSLIAIFSNYKKDQNKLEEASAYIYYALEIFERLDNDRYILEYNQFFFSGVYFPEYANPLKRSYRPSEKFYSDYLETLEVLQEIEPEKGWIKVAITKLKNKINYTKNTTEPPICGGLAPAPKFCPWLKGVEEAKEGDLITFVFFDKALDEVTAFEHTWKVFPADARIVSGLGTNAIIVDTTGLGGQTVTVEIDIENRRGIYDEDCFKNLVWKTEIIP